MEVVKIVLSGPFPFIGFLVVFAISLHYLVNLIQLAWSRFMRMIMVSKQGWPPSHLDADGDWPESVKGEDEIE